MRQTFWGSEAVVGAILAKSLPALWVLTFIWGASELTAAKAANKTAPNTPSPASTLTRDEIEDENRVRFYRMAIATARQNKVKKEAEALRAARALKRLSKLNAGVAVSEQELRTAHYEKQATELEVEELKHILDELHLDAEIAELNRRWAAGESEDIQVIAKYHYERWKNIAELSRVSLKRAQALQDLTRWKLSAAKNLRKTNSMSEQELDDVILENAEADAEYQKALLQIAEAEKAAEEAHLTWVRAQQEAAKNATTAPNPAPSPAPSP